MCYFLVSGNNKSLIGVSVSEPHIYESALAVPIIFLYLSTWATNILNVLSTLSISVKIVPATVLNCDVRL